MIGRGCGGVADGVRGSGAADECMAPAGNFSL